MKSQQPRHRLFALVVMLAGASALPHTAAAQTRPGASAAPQFVCNQVTAMTLTREWYQAGFEQSPGIADDRWQMKARQSGYITEWSNPNSEDRKSTRLNSSHTVISYAVFCLKKKTIINHY